MTIEQVWPEWKTEKILGRGSFGTVYKCCKETGNEKEYSAIKVISIPRDDYEATEIGSESMTKEESKNYYKDIVDDFLNEIKILESLKGVKNIVNIYDSKVVEKEDGIGWQIFIRMELLTDFNTYSSDKEFTPEDVKKFAIDICNALIVCSEKRIIHRDIKPENIFVDDEGNYKLGDFGVAKQMEKTYASTIRGALNYIAPEVIAAKKYDSRADIYSLGLVMYKLLNNNRLPFLDPNKQIVKHSERQDAYERRMRGEKIPPLQNVDENLNEIILRCCEFKAENRYRTAAELKQALESRNAKDKGIGRFIKKHKLISAVALLLVVSIISGSVIVCKLKDHSLGGGDSGEKKTTNSQNTKTIETATEKHNIFDSYKNILVTNDMCSYYMIDMDEDETPELILDKRTTNSLGYSVRVLDLYTFTEDKGAVKFGEINDCDFESSLYKIENEKDLFVYILNYDDNRGGYQQLINRYHKNETELSVSTFLDKYYESWCLELEENCFSCEYKSLTASNNKVESYFSLLSDTVRDKVNPYLDYSQFGIYDTSDFNYNSNSTGKYLSVNREDLFNLGTGAENSESFINNILGYFHCDCPIDYYGKNGSTEDLIRRIIGEGAYGETYEYYFGDFTTIKYSNKHDPLNMFSEATGTDFGSTGEYYAIPAENIRWIMKNIFNNTDWVDSYKVDEENFKCYLLNGTFYAEHIDFDGGDYTQYQIESITDNENGTYDVSCVDNNQLYDRIEMTVALKNIEGERRWTLIKLEK